MTLSLVGYVHGIANSPSTINITLPGGSAAGDKCVGSANATLSNSATPTGFTLLDGPTATDGSEIRSFHRTLDSTDISNGYLTMPGSPDYHDLPYQLWVWHSTAGTPTIDGHSARQAFDASTPTTVCNAVQITTSSNGSAVCVTLGAHNSVGTTWSATPGSVTTDENAPAGLDHAIYAYHFTQVTAGITPAQSATIDIAFAREVSTSIGVADPGGSTVTGTAAITLAAFVSTASGSSVRGSAAITLGAFISAGVGAQNAVLRGTIWTKTLSGAGGTETFTASAAVETALAFAVLHGAAAVDASAVTSGISDVADSPSVVTTAADELVLWGHFRDAADITTTPGTGTNIGPVHSSANATRTSVGINYQAQAVAGASGTRRFAGVAANSWAAATVSVTSAPPGLITGTAAITLGAFVGAASGKITVTGTATITLASFVSAATGTFTPAAGTSTAPVITGELTSFPRLARGFSSPRWG